LALQEIAAFLSEEQGSKGMLMMNPLYYAEMIGWDKYSNFAYPGEEPTAKEDAKEKETLNVPADQYARYYQSIMGGDYKHYYDHYCKTYGNKPLPIPGQYPYA
jgi:hypothetical protein